MPAQKPDANERLIIGIFGAGLVILPPFVKGLAAVFASEVTREVQIVTGGSLFGLGLIMAFSVYLTWKVEEEHMYKCFFNAMGIPGFVISYILGFQLL